MKKIIFEFILQIESILNKYRVDYYRYKFARNVEIDPTVMFHKNTAVVIFESGSKSKLRIGQNCDFRRNCLIALDGDGSLEIGNDNFFNNGCSITCLGTVIIGEGNLFGENVKIYDHGHVYNNLNAPIREQGFKLGRVVIGQNCWFGSNCTILNNVEIGDNVIIGANNLIYKSVPSNTIVLSGTDSRFVCRQ